ncbi:MAG: VOC family protein [Pseudomonadota bacterium]
MAKELIASIGPVMQLAFVPRDFDAAVTHWTEMMGVGPFFWIENAGLQNATFNGAPSEAEFGLALAYWGDVQIELIKQHNDAPSIYNTQPWAGAGGMHHVCLLTDDIEDARAKALASGAELVTTADLPGGGAVFYAATGGAEGLVEVLQPAPGGLEFFAMMKQAAADWDGADRLRPVG